MRNTVVVPLGSRSYSIDIDSSLLKNPERITSHIKGAKALIVTNETLKPLYGDTLCAALDPYLDVSLLALPDGESFKTLQTVETIFDRLLADRHDRQTTLIALGGGVVGDMVGFAAACYQRGVDFIQVPTTLLSQVDSSVGGKTGVNHPAGKNMIGAFKQPTAVFIDIDVLQTLPAREFSAGMAEVIKYGLIWDDTFLSWIEDNAQLLLARNPRALSYVIKRSCEIKSEVVAADETEQGQRAILNLGHTFGHAIETHFGYGHYLHGEAVAIGMHIAITLSCEIAVFDENYLSRVRNLLEFFNLPTHVPHSMTDSDFFELMSLDKKVANGAIRYVLLDRAGSAVVTDNIEPALVSKAIQACTAS